MTRNVAVFVFCECFLNLFLIDIDLGGGSLPSRLKEGDITFLSASACRNAWGTTVSSSIHLCVIDYGEKYGACNVSISNSFLNC